MSIAQDIITEHSGGIIKMPKNVSLGHFFTKIVFGVKNSSPINNNLGHSISYDQKMLRIETI